MSEPKIGEFLQNFDVQISAGSLSNILTNTAKSFENEFHDLFTAGLASTPYQQTDDTSARVAGKFYHTHIVCNPYYTLGLALDKSIFTGVLTGRRLRQQRRKGNTADACP